MPAVLCAGDNFYPAGVTSPEDPTFAASFSKIYHHRSLQARGGSGGRVALAGLAGGAVWAPLLSEAWPR